MAQQGFFPYSYAPTGIWTDVSSVAPLFRDLNPGRFTDWATEAAATNLVVEVDQEQGRDDADDEEPCPGCVEDGVVWMLPQVGHLHKLALVHHFAVADVLKKKKNCSRVYWSRFLEVVGQSTEVVFALLTQLSRVWFTAFPWFIDVTA